MGCGHSNAIVAPMQIEPTKIIAPKSIHDLQQRKNTLKVIEPSMKVLSVKPIGQNKQNETLQPEKQSKAIQTVSSCTYKAAQSKSNRTLDVMAVNDVQPQTVAMSPSKILCPKTEEKELKKQRKNKKRRKQSQPIQKQLKRLYGL